MNLYPSKVFLNGEILDYQNAKISVFDRGFLFGDSIYEVMVQINNEFFYKDAHINRLKNCLNKISIDFDVSTLPDKIEEVLAASNFESKNCLLYIQVTRGIAPRKHAFSKNITPTLMMYALPFNLPDINLNHIKTVTLKDTRWHRCDIKTTSLLGNVLANQYAANNDCYETLLIREGIITEASHCNVFFVKDEVIYTHPANEHILDGITRQIVIELCENLNLSLVEKPILEEQITTMDEAFLTGTSTQIASIKKIDDHYFYKDDEIGEITIKLQNAFLKLKGSN